MNTGNTGIPLQQVTQQAFSALQSGQASKAKSLFEKIVASGKADDSHWLGLAYACSQTGDEAKTLAAVNKALELQPNNIRAVILKADSLARLEKKVESLKFYKYALRLMANAQNIPTDIQQGLVRAQTACDLQKDEYRSFLMEKLASGGYSPGAGSRRFQQSLELAPG